MRIASRAAVATGALLALTFVVRAAFGLTAAGAFLSGQRWVEAGDYPAARAALASARVGMYRPEALWLAGESALGVWDSLTATDQAGDPGRLMLAEAAASFLRGQAASPASAWYTASIAGVYARRERMRRAQAVVDLAELDRGPWALVGDDGRVALGLARMALKREPTRFEFADQLALLLLANGLETEAARAIDVSARILPDFGAHPNLSFEALPRDVVESFWRTSRALAPGDAPMILRERHLLSLGILGRRLGHLNEAEQDLREALRSPGTELFHAEDAFHLGLVLLDAKRTAEAETMLALAGRQPVFESGVAETRARIAESEGRFDDALVQLREARRLRPSELGVLLDFARVAGKTGDWDAAVEALNWAKVVQPSSPAPERAMAEIYLAQGKVESARGAIARLKALTGATDEVAALEARLTPPLDRPVP